MSTGQWVLVVAVVTAVAFGTWRAMTDGRFRGTHRVRGAQDAEERVEHVESVRVTDEEGVEVAAVDARESVVTGTPYVDQLGQRATLLQFSSAFCAPCRATRRVLEEVTAVVPGVAHLEVDAESHLELVRRVNIMRTPTTLVLDAAGREVTRATGAPTKSQVIAALGMVD